jgi:hypothetical protein
MALAPAAQAGLIGNAGITWLYPDTLTTYASDTIAVGSTLNCPGSSPICSGYGSNGTEVFGVTSASITYVVANSTSTGYSSGAFNGFDFTGLTFADAGSLASFGLVTNIAGLIPADVSFTGNSIEINLQGLPVNGTFTLNLSETGSSVPEPGSLISVGAALGGLTLLLFRRRIARA